MLMEIVNQIERERETNWEGRRAGAVGGRRFKRTWTTSSAKRLP